jgi:hypothetical protein
MSEPTRTDHGGDEMNATGKHRAWTGETEGARARPGNREAQNWLDRAQPANPRHAAITRSLYSWSNYKSWTEKVKSSWDKEKK